MSLNKYDTFIRYYYVLNLIAKLSNLGVKSN